MSAKRKDHTPSTPQQDNGGITNKTDGDQRRFIDKHFGKMMAVVIVVTLLVNVAIWFAPPVLFGGMMPNTTPNQRMNPQQTPPAANQSPPASQSAPSRATGQPTELLILGEQRFSQVCANCHGASGQGYAAASAPPLNGSAHAWHHPDSQIRGWLRNGYNTMPAVPSNWTDRDIDAVLAYVKQWWTPEQQAFQAGLE